MHDGPVDESALLLHSQSMSDTNQSLASVPVTDNFVVWTVLAGTVSMSLLTIGNCTSFDVGALPVTRKNPQTLIWNSSRDLVDDYISQSRYVAQ